MMAGNEGMEKRRKAGGARPLYLATVKAAHMIQLAHFCSPRPDPLHPPQPHCSLTPGLLRGSQAVLGEDDEAYELLRHLLLELVLLCLLVQTEHEV